MAFISQGTGLQLGQTDVTTDIQTQLADTQEMIKKIIIGVAIVAVLSWVLMSLKK